MIFPVRKLGTVGIITDTPAFELPTPALSNGVNVRFRDGEIVRAPVMKQYSNALVGTEPTHIMAVPYNSENERIIHAHLNGRIYMQDNNVATDLTPASWVDSNNASRWTDTSVSRVFYLTRPDTLPLYLTDTATAFAAIPTWPDTWRTRALRGFREFLVAIGPTEGSDDRPKRVRWSDVQVGDTPPLSFDASDTTTLAGFTDLLSMQGELIDGATLGNSMMLYGTREVWSMDYVGGTFIFDFRSLFSDDGVVAPNCVVSVEGRHFVFGLTSLYMHDGVNKVDIGTNISSYVYRTLDRSNQDKCFVTVDRVNSEVLFCYPSTDNTAAFTGGRYCNRAAVFNYRYNTWSLADLPNVSGAIYTPISLDKTWTNSAGTWAQSQSTWSTLSPTVLPSLVFAANRLNDITEPRIVVEDFPTTGYVTKPVDVECSAPVAFIERVGLDFNEVSGDAASVNHINRIVPQFRKTSNHPLYFQVGGAMVPTAVPTYNPTVTFNPTTQYKVDTRITSRYLAYKIQSSDISEWALSGMGMHVLRLSKR